jgi:hypothetical protein
VHLFRPGLGFLIEAEQILKNRRGQKALFGRSTHNVFRVRSDKNFEKSSFCTHSLKIGSSRLSSECGGNNFPHAVFFTQ